MIVRHAYQTKLNELRKTWPGSAETRELILGAMEQLFSKLERIETERRLWTTVVEIRNRALAGAER
jgi:hypothetical protein